MNSLQKHVLVLGQRSQELDVLGSLLKQMRYSVAIANSKDQAVAQMSQAQPCLVILTGNYQNWSQTLVNDLRSNANTCNITIVALTDCHDPSWLYQEESLGFDGFLVNPISGDVLISLVHSAWARQTCFAVN